MNFDQSSVICQANHHGRKLMISCCLTTFLITCGLYQNSQGQQPQYSQQAAYSQSFNPYQQVGFQHPQPADSGYASLDGSGESQISYEYIDRQRQHGKYAREGYVNGETPYDDVFKNVLHNSWLRFEYLNWSIKGPGDKSLGAPTLLTNNDPANPFEIFIPEFFGGFFPVRTSVPEVGKVDLPSNNGFRASTGIELSFGELEASAFVLEQSEQLFDYTHFISTTIFAPNVISQTYLNNGQVSNLSFDYDVSYYTAYTSQVFGADANLHIDVRNVDLGLNHDVLVGFRYVHLSERLQQRGQFDLFGTAPVTNVEYDSSTRNNVFGPQIGFRSEFKHQYFTLGVQNKIAAGFNGLETSLTEAIFDANTGSSNTQSQSATQFAPVYDLNVYGKIKISEHFLINVGYNFLWVGRVSRPADNIIYDTDATGAIDSKLQVNNADFFVHGISLGTEITF